MREVSINARTAHEQANSAAVEVMLITIEHEALETPVRLSTDPTERLSVEPLRYGTRSRWNSADPLTDPYFFVLVSATLPSDQEDAPTAFSLTLANVDNDIAKLLRSFTTPPTVHMALVMAESPDDVEREARGLQMTSADGDAEIVELVITRQEIEAETVPMDRFTAQRFPGLFR
ncbi:MAG: hypothetical protein RLO16_01500 [Marinovum algicola]|uniref:hypothetical protein n=1 Tax=Marinovum algicola TaxID=42444 RepID=UPI0032EB78F0